MEPLDDRVIQNKGLFALLMRLSMFDSLTVLVHVRQCHAIGVSCDNGLLCVSVCLCEAGFQDHNTSLTPSTQTEPTQQRTALGPPIPKLEEACYRHHRPSPASLGHSGGLHHRLILADGQRIPIESHVGYEVTLGDEGLVMVACGMSIGLRRRIIR